MVVLPAASRPTAHNQTEKFLTDKQNTRTKKVFFGKGGSRDRWAALTHEYPHVLLAEEPLPDAGHSQTHPGWRQLEHSGDVDDQNSGDSLCVLD